MRTLCVLGIAGFTGRYMERFLHNAALTGELRCVGVDKSIDAVARTGSFTYNAVDATDPARFTELLSRINPSLVVNLIGTYATRAFTDMMRVNVGVSETVLAACAQGRITPEKVLLIGSAAELGDVRTVPATEEEPARPLTPYGLTKAFQTQLAGYYFRTHGVPVVVARTFNLSGDDVPEELALGRFRRLIAEAGEGEEIRVGNLESRRDFIPVEEAVSRYWTLLMRGQPGQLYNVCSGTSIRMRDALEEMIRRSGKHLVAVTDPRYVKRNDVPEIVGSTVKFDAISF